MNAIEPTERDQRLWSAQEEAVAQVTPGEALTLPMFEETVRIEKRAVEAGRVRIRTDTETRDQVLRERLRSESVSVTRVPVNRTLAEGEAAPVTRVEDGMTIIPVLEEILVVEKRLVLKEEVHIRQTYADEDVEVPVTLRKQHAVVERVGADGRVREPTPGSGMDPTIPSSQETTS